MMGQWNSEIGGQRSEIGRQGRMLRNKVAEYRNITFHSSHVTRPASRFSVTRHFIDSHQSYTYFNGTR
jgi:hypothetical protein